MTCPEVSLVKYVKAKPGFKFQIDGNYYHKKFVGWDDRAIISYSSCLILPLTKSMSAKGWF
jgi:hypothetical protein